MDPDILNYIKSQRVGVLAVEMMDGSPHGATVHFAHMDNPLAFFFETNREYRKAEPLFGREITRATFVIGSTESDMRTLQLDGVVQLLKPEELETYDTVYFGKYPEERGKTYGGTPIFFKFTPTWWRFTDWTRPEGKLIILSK